MTSQFWKIFGVVFVVAFAANALIAFLWERSFPGSPLRWDTTTTNAVVVALIISFVARRQQRRIK